MAALEFIVYNSNNPSGSNKKFKETMKLIKTQKLNAKLETVRLFVDTKLKNARSVFEQAYVHLQILLIKGYHYWDVILEKNPKDNHGALLLGTIPPQSQIKKIKNKHAIHTVIRAVEDRELGLFPHQWNLEYPEKNKDKEEKSEDRITIIVTEEIKDEDNENIKQLTIADHTTKIKADENSDGYEKLLERLKIMHQARLQGNNVYVHCRAGKGRSFFIIACYLVCFENWSLVGAFEHVKRKRPQVSDNELKMQDVNDFARWFYTEGKNTIEPESQIQATKIANFAEGNFKYRRIGESRLAPAEKDIANPVRDKLQPSKIGKRIFKIPESIFETPASIFSWYSNLQRAYYLCKLAQPLLDYYMYYKIIFRTHYRQKYIQSINEIAEELSLIFKERKGTFSNDQAETFYTTFCDLEKIGEVLTGEYKVPKEKLAKLDESLAEINNDAAFGKVRVQAACQKLGDIYQHSIDRINEYRKLKVNRLKTHKPGPTLGEDNSASSEITHNEMTEESTKETSEVNWETYTSKRVSELDKYLKTTKELSDEAFNTKAEELNSKNFLQKVLDNAKLIQEIDRKTPNTPSEEEKTTHGESSWEAIKKWLMDAINDFVNNFKDERKNRIVSTINSNITLFKKSFQADQKLTQETPEQKTATFN